MDELCLKHLTSLTHRKGIRYMLSSLLGLHLNQWEEIAEGVTQLNVGQNN